MSWIMSIAQYSALLYLPEVSTERQYMPPSITLDRQQLNLALFVAQSSLPYAGLGLFAAQPIGPGEPVAIMQTPVLMRTASRCRQYLRNL